LIDPVTGTWNEQLIMDFYPEGANVILTIPIDVKMSDWSAWHYDPMGRFSVKSAYKLSVQIRDQEMGRDASTSMAVAASNENGLQWHKI
jgi:glucose dehydrogenase